MDAHSSVLALSAHSQTHTPTQRGIHHLRTSRFLVAFKGKTRCHTNHERLFLLGIQKINSTVRYSAILVISTYSMTTLEGWYESFERINQVEQKNGTTINQCCDW